MIESSSDILLPQIAANFLLTQLFLILFCLIIGLYIARKLKLSWMQIAMAFSLLSMSELAKYAVSYALTFTVFSSTDAFLYALGDIFIRAVFVSVLCVSLWVIFKNKNLKPTKQTAVALGAVLWISMCVFVVISEILIFSMDISYGASASDLAAAYGEEPYMAMAHMPILLISLGLAIAMSSLLCRFFARGNHDMVLYAFVLDSALVLSGSFGNSYATAAHHIIQLILILAVLYYTKELWMKK